MSSTYNQLVDLQKSNFRPHGHDFDLYSMIDERFIYNYSSLDEAALNKLFYNYLSSGVFVIPDVVLDEFNNKEGLKNITLNNSDAIVPSIPEIQRIQKEIVKKYPNLIKSTSTMHNADPWVISSAKFYNGTVLSNETIK